MVRRRDVLMGIGSLAAAGGLRHCRASEASEYPLKSPAPTVSPSNDLPRKQDFLITDGYTYLNAAYTHPIPSVSLEAARNAALGRSSLPNLASRSNSSSTAQPETPKTLFSKLINAKPSEIAYVSSTSAGENLVVQALELDHKFDGNVVSDGLHFEGALLHLLELQKRGLDVRIVRPTEDGRIDPKHLEAVVDRKTKLIEVSSISMYNGFQHDLKAICDLAHAHGALVYADIIHSAGAEPFDVRACGVDFAACSTFKWLMGDFGIGFLFAREELLDKISRPVSGYFQARNLQPVWPPDLPESGYLPVSYELERTAAGVFESGTLAGSAGIHFALLTASLKYLLELGVEKIHAYRQPLIQKLQQEVPRLGLRSITPPDSSSGLVTFVQNGIGQSSIAEKLKAAKIDVRLSRDWLRVSPSIYNDLADVDRFLEAIS